MNSVKAACEGLWYANDMVFQVPLEESINLLRIPRSFTPKNRSWIRIAKPPVYRGDLAFIVDVVYPDGLNVFFVPRIAMERQQVKRKPSGLKAPGGRRGQLHRPAQSLFNPEVVQSVYGEASVQQRNQVFVFKGTTFKNGFVSDIFPLAHFLPAEATPTIEELNTFQLCPEITLEDVGIGYLQRIVSNDNVKVVTGQQKGLVGKVKERSQDTVTIEYIQLGDSAMSTVSLPARDVRKKFSVGDQVRVIFGDHRGVIGWVTGEVELITIEDTTLFLVQTHNKEGMKTFPGLVIFDDKEMQSVCFSLLFISPLIEIYSRSLSPTLLLNSTVRNTAGSRKRDRGPTRSVKNF